MASRLTPQDLAILRSRSIELHEADFRTFDEAKRLLARAVGTGPDELTTVETDQLRRIFASTAGVELVGRPGKRNPQEYHEVRVTTGRQGGEIRAKNLTPERRREIAQKAAATRWTNHPS